MSNSYWRAYVIWIALLISGCASLPLEQGRANVQALLQSRVPESLTGVDAQLAMWLETPLTLERAQQIALMLNPSLKADYARLGLSAADVFEAERLQNPSMAMSWLFPLGSAEGSKVSASLLMPFGDLLLRGARRRIAATEYSAVQESLTANILDVLAATQRAWFECVAANQRVVVRRSISEAAQLAADTALKYKEAGNISALTWQVQRAEASQSRIALNYSQMELADARARLQKKLGLSASQAVWKVPDSLPAMPAATGPPVEELIAKALEGRLDISAARRHVQALRDRAATTRRYRSLWGSHAGLSLDRESDGASRVGPSFELTLPIFQQGQAAVARADSELAAAEAQLTALELSAHADLAQQMARIEIAREQVHAYRDGLIPEREAIVAELTKQANFMLVDSFAVLLARQQEYAAYADYVDALLRFWIAHVELIDAIGSQRSLEGSP